MVAGGVVEAGNVSSEGGERKRETKGEQEDEGKGGEMKKKKKKKKKMDWPSSELQPGFKGDIILLI